MYVLKLVRSIPHLFLTCCKNIEVVTLPTVVRFNNIEFRMLWLSMELASDVKTTAALSLQRLSEQYWLSDSGLNSSPSEIRRYSYCLWQFC